MGCPSYTCYSILRLVWNFQFKVKTDPEQNQPFNARTQFNFFYDPDDSLPAPPHPPTDYLNFSSCWSRSSYYGDSIHVHPSSLLHCSPCPQWWLEWLPGPKSKVRSLSSISPTISIQVLLLSSSKSSLASSWWNITDVIRCVIRAMDELISDHVAWDNKTAWVNYSLLLLSLLSSLSLTSL